MVADFLEVFFMLNFFLFCMLNLLNTYSKYSRQLPFPLAPSTDMAIVHPLKTILSLWNRQTPPLSNYRVYVKLLIVAE